jgi:hypothetical protein
MCGAVKDYGRKQGKLTVKRKGKVIPVTDCGGP